MTHWMDTGRFDDDSDIEQEPRHWDPLTLIAAQLNTRFTPLGGWVRQAACRDAVDRTLWDGLPDRDEPVQPTPAVSARRQRDAARVCAGCLVRAECLADARVNDATVAVIRGGVLFNPPTRIDGERVEHDLIALNAAGKLQGTPAGRGRPSTLTAA